LYTAPVDGVSSLIHETTEQVRLQVALEVERAEGVVRRSKCSRQLFQPPGRWSENPNQD